MQKKYYQNSLFLLIFKRKVTEKDYCVLKNIVNIKNYSLKDKRILLYLILKNKIYSINQPKGKQIIQMTNT